MLVKRSAFQLKGVCWSPQLWKLWVELTWCMEALSGWNRRQTADIDLEEHSCQCLIQL